MASRRLDTRDVSLIRGALSDEDSAHIKKCFHVLDADRQGVLRHDLIETLFRSLGQTPTEKEMRNWIKEYELPEACSVEKFEEFFVTYYKEPAGEETLLRAFRTLDPMRKGFVKQEKIKEILASIGDALDEQEVKELFLQLGIKPSDDNVEYKSLIKRLCQGPARPKSLKVDL